MFDLIIVGGGPAGYLAAERAGHAGLSVAVVEKNKLGGVCLNEGCIPSKSLLNTAKVYDHALHGKEFGVTAQGLAISHEAAMKRKDKVVRTLVAGVKAKLKGVSCQVFEAEATVRGRAGEGFAVQAGAEVIQGRRLLIAAGSSAIVPPIPGVLEAVAEGRAWTNREALSAPCVPAKLVIVGGGVIGLEMAAYYRTAGSEVTIVEMLPAIAGQTDGELSAMLRRAYEARGVRFLTSTKVTGVTKDSVLCEGEAGAVSLPADAVLLSIGRRANLSGYGLESLGVVTGRGGIVTDNRLRTSIPGVWAAGDVNGVSMLAHTAYRESEVAVNDMLGRRDVMRYSAIPSVIYTSPEVASVGYTQEAAQAAGFLSKAASLSMRYSGRFLAENTGDGLCKVVIDEKTRRILGVHMLGSYASEIIWGAAALIETELSVDEAREIVFPHPTVSEIIREVLFEL